MESPRFLRKIVLAAALLCMAFGLQAQSAKYIEALKNYQQGETAEALRLFQEEFQENPSNDAACYYIAAICSNDPDRRHETENWLKRAIELSPDNFWYRYNLALCYLHTERPELAVPMLEQLTAEFPKKTELYFDLINVYLTDNEIEKALSTLDKIDAIRGRSEIVGLTRTELLLKKPDANPDSVYQSLADYYAECRTPRLASVLGDYFASTYRDSLALSYYDEALAIEPDYTPAWFGKAGVYQMLRQYGNFFSSISHVMRDPYVQPEAKAAQVEQMTANPQFVRTFSEEFDQMMLDLRTAHPTDSTINALIGGFWYRTGRPELAIEIMRQNMEQHPESFDAAMQYLFLLYYQQAWPALSDNATVAIQRFPESPDLLQLRAIALSQMKEYTEALQDYEAILRMHPKDTTVMKVTYSSMGDLYHQMGDAKNSYKHYDKALKIDPDYNPVLNNYAYYLSLEGKNLKKAKEMSRKTITAEPDNPTYLDTYAWILHLLGQDIEAKAIFKHAMLYGGKESRTILEHYAVVLEALGEKDLANIYYKQAAAMAADE
ncbi:MAG: tetratricopeptide repeat protein [Bacteroidales bacterium]|nr:tetratricopeptide repeat protein [Bacteroidales bacterium]